MLGCLLFKHNTPATRYSTLYWPCLLLALIGSPLHTRADDRVVTDAEVDRAITQAVEWIKSQRTEQGHWEKHINENDRYWAGESALALLALLYAGENPRQDDMDRSLTWLAAQELKATYTYATRAHALALVPGKKFRTRLQEDLNWLLSSVGRQDSRHPGAYDYETPTEPGRVSRFDNSNSQYGVLGAWMAADAGVNVPDWYWELVRDHWLRHQQDDGGWAYKARGKSTGSMTAAGLATLYVVLDWLYAGDEGAFNGTKSSNCGEHKSSGRLLGAINRGLDWFGREYTADNPHGDDQWKYYYLYGVERMGRASGQKYFRNRDWFHTGARFLIEEQKDDGQWQDSSEHMNPLRNTCFGLMFLCHGRAPLMFNKLQHGDDWNNKLRDISGITRYTQRTFERLLNWQIVRLDSELDDLMEAPVLYMSGHTAWKFSEVEVQKLREYCQRGGIILGVACCSREEFNNGFKALTQQMFPDLPLRPLSNDHPLLSGEVQFPIADMPMMLEVNNGVRTLMLLSTKDICAPWNQYRVRRWENYFQFACNLYLYATDKTTIRSRLETPDIPLQQVDVDSTIQVARIKYTGRWNTEPYGWTRVKNFMNNTTYARLLVTSGVTLDSDDLREFDIAYISGTRAFELSDDELKGLGRFLSGGGTLLADAAGGSREFTQSLEKYVTAVLKMQPKYLEPDSAILTGEGVPEADALTGMVYRRAARREGSGRRLPRLKAYQLKRRVAVIYSPIDLSTGLLGTHVYNCYGFEGDSALRIVRNMLLYARLTTAQKARIARKERG